MLGSLIRMGFKLSIPVCIVAGAALLLVIAMNSFRLDLDVLEESFDQALKKASTIQELAREDYQKETLAALPRNARNGDVQYLDEALDQAMVQVDPARPPSAAGDGILHAIEFEGSEPGFRSNNGRSTVSAGDGKLHVIQGSRDYLVSTEPVGLPKRDIAKIEIRARLKKGKQLRLGWPAEFRPDKLWQYNLTVDVIPDGEFHNYSVYAANALKRGLNSGDMLNTFIIGASTEEGDEVEVDYVRFVSKLANYQKTPRGVTYETLGAEMRRALYMVPSQSLQFEVSVPANEPVLDFGMGVLQNDPPVDFEVSINDAGTISTRAQTLSSSDSWTDARIDMSPYAGRSVTLTFKASGDAGNVALWSNPVVYEKPSERFNVVFILEDTLRADHTSVQGYERPTTPRKERLARSASIFESNYSQATMTRPSVPSIMTGLLPSATGVWQFSDALREEYLTVAEILRSQGFATASFLQNANAGPLAGLQQGFDSLIDEKLIGKTTAGLLGDRLEAWLDHNGERNFFLNLHFIDPHGPYDPPVDYRHWYRKEEGELPVERAEHFDPDWIEEPTQESRRGLYDGEIASNDDLLDRFLKRLDELGLRDDTLVIFLSDHGEFLGERGMWGHHPPGLREVTHTPLIISYPRRFAEGGRFPHNVANLDIVPTVLELAGVERDTLMLQGDSLVDLLEGRRLDYFENRVVVSEEPSRMRIKGEATGTGSVHFQNWQLINSSTFGKGGLPLPDWFTTKVYDVVSDPQQTRQVQSFVPDFRTKRAMDGFLHELQQTNIEAWRALTGGVTETVESDPEVRERLRALGYIH